MYLLASFFFFFKQKTAYEMRISDWSSDVCSSDLGLPPPETRGFAWIGHRKTSAQRSAQTAAELVVTPNISGSPSARTLCRNWSGVRSATRRPLRLSSEDKIGRAHV